MQRIWDRNEQGEETGTQVIKLEGSPRARREVQTSTSEKKFWGTGWTPPLDIHALNIFIEHLTHDCASVDDSEAICPW